MQKDKERRNENSTTIKNERRKKYKKDKKEEMRSAPQERKRKSNRERKEGRKECGRNAHNRETKGFRNLKP